MPPKGEPTAALRREGIRFVYASHWLSAWVKAESRGTIGVQESNINVSPQALRGVEVRPGLPGRDLRLSGPLDGATWTPLSPLTWAGSVYWTGTELLRNGGPRWAVTFPRTTLRDLRLSPAGPLRDPWTIVEVECLQ